MTFDLKKREDKGLSRRSTHEPLPEPWAAKFDEDGKPVKRPVRTPPRS